MGAVIFETFEPGARTSESVQKIHDAELAKARDEAYANGFKDGVSVTNDAFQTSQNEIATAIQEALSDTCFSQSAAVQKSLTEVVLIVEKFCTALAPNFSKAGFGAELGELLHVALKEAASSELVVSYSASDEKTVKDLVGDKLDDVSLSLDQSLLQGQIRIHRNDGFDSLDMNEAAARGLLEISKFTNLINNEEVDNDSIAVSN